MKHLPMDAEFESEPIRIPADETGAVYANDFEVWITRYDAALDLHVLGQPEDEERPAHPLVRVRLPVAMLLPVSAALVNALDEHERRFRGDA